MSSLPQARRPVLPARDATKTIPVIFVAGIDPIAEQIGHPGFSSTECKRHRLDYRSDRPHRKTNAAYQGDFCLSLKAIAFLSRTGNPGNAEYVGEAEQATQALGVRLHVIPTRGPEEFEGAFHKCTRAPGAGALVPMNDATFTSGREKLIELAGRHRLPGVYALRDSP